MYLISQLHCLWCHEHLMLTFYICAWSEHNSFACYEDLNDACMIWAQFCCFYYLDSHEFTVFYCFLSLLGYDLLLVQNLAQLHCLDDYLNHLCMIWAQFCCFYFLYSHEFTVFYCFLSLLGYDFLLVQNLAQLHCLDDYLNHLCMIWAQFYCFYFLYSHEFTVFYCFLSLLWPLYF